VLDQFRHPRNALAIALLMVLIAVLVWRGFIPANGPSGAAILAREGAEVFRSLHMAAISDSDLVRLGLNAFDGGSDGDDIPKRERDRLIDTLTSFITLHSDPQRVDDYRRFRETTGSRLRPLSTMMGDFGAGEGFEAMVGSPAPVDLDSWSFFVRMRNEQTSYGGGANRVVAMANGAPGVIIVARSIKSPDERVPMLNGTFSARVWHGGRSRGSRSWFEPPSTVESVLVDAGVVLVARVGVVYEYADGSRRPTVFDFHFDSSQGWWVLDSIALTNFDDARVMPLDF
jgi:hypothetical protein